MRKTKNQLKGQAAEAAACEFLIAQGLQFVRQNFLCKAGELDLIFQDQKSLVFVEVRFRKNRQFGGAAASITPAKQRRLRRAAEFYLQSLQQQPPCRFDVVAMAWDARGHYFCENWIKNAF